MDYWMGALDIVIRSVISVGYLFILTRFMGRKQISQLSFFDYTIGISIGSIAAEMASNDSVLYFYGLLSMGIYAIIAIAISIATNKSLILRRFFNGRAYLLIDKGKVVGKNLGKVRYDINDLLSEARYAGYFNIADIYSAVMETNGRISFLPISAKTPPCLEDLKINKPQQGLVAAVIVDGRIMEENLKASGFNVVWLYAELQKQGNLKASEVMLATVDNDELSVYEKLKDLKPRTVLD